MPETATRERIKTMQAFGAKVVLTPASQSMEGAIDYAREKLQEGGYKMLNQFSNPDNPLAHFRTTGPEIWKDTRGQITHFVSAMGTTGTIMGVSEFLKSQVQDVRIIGVQPSEGSEIPGIRRWPKEYLPKIYDPAKVDRIVDVSGEQARYMTRELAIHEGILCGMSSGGAAHAAITLSGELKKGLLVFIICDIGDRYLSSDLF
jgi:cysteine synthase B